MKTTARILLAALLCAGTASCQEKRTVKATVLEEDGKTPVEGADVTVKFLGATGEQDVVVEGKSDAAGAFSARGAALLRMHVLVTKPGYYRTLVAGLDKTKDHDVTLVLREKKNPIPLYARKVTLGFPENRKWIGFDFEVGDWVAPHGKGMTTDVTLRCDTQKTGERDGEGSVEIKFGEDEGLRLMEENYLKVSRLKMPHEAPVGEYDPSFTRKEESYHNRNFRPGVGYFFRTRVVKEGEKIVSSNYGKLLSDIRFSPRHYFYPDKPGRFATISFEYCFNPTPNDRNLEFDPQRNLFKDLKPEEMVREP